MCSCIPKDHNLPVWPEAVAIVFPSGENVIEFTQAVCPFSSVMNVPSKGKENTATDVSTKNKGKVESGEGDARDTYVCESSHPYPSLAYSSLPPA